MNLGALNVTTLNGGVTDFTVRASISGNCFAAGSATGRVLAYARLGSTPTAVTSVLPLVYAPQQITTTGEARTSLALNTRRWTQTAQAQATATVAHTILRTVPGEIPATASAATTLVGRLVYGDGAEAKAQVSLTTRMGVRSVVSASAAAVATVAPRYVIREAVAASPQATMGVAYQIGTGYRDPTASLCRAFAGAGYTILRGITTPTLSAPKATVTHSLTVLKLHMGLIPVYSRATCAHNVTVGHGWAGPVYGFARATGSHNVTVGSHRTGLVPAHGSATTQVDHRVVAHLGQMSAQARATALVDFELVKRIPWDEHAPDERVYRVNPEQFEFKVLS